MNIAGNRRALRTGALALAVGLVLLAGCKREPDTTAAPTDGAATTQPDTTAPQATVDAPLELRDVIENTPQAVVGISYPPDVNRYPGLAKALSDYATAARGELQQAVDGLGNDKPTMPYELSLSFEKLLETPQMVVISADGSRYTGGAHGEPLVARFVWLPEQQRMLTAETLITDTKGWGAVSDYVADQLRERVATRLSSDDMEPGQQQEALRSASRMIADGTGASADNFSQFQPVTDPNGLITAVRFVFPPYQVGPYSDGTQTVDVPAAVLVPHVAPAYAGLFAKG
ncbi:DUF4163 domain-containing protein [uncultured Stenotrophomonas sp.]|uniref:DUF3298 and DUF4163 domain-containing protein n=1 Tax=uncultured Stenotrophomonas sp. TaxID=165438 RepID=UPI0028E486BC|nr:DUF4163 domain-containing protein [uncultured Stenotrophomonas sp.]